MTILKVMLVIWKSKDENLKRWRPKKIQAQKGENYELHYCINN